MLLLHQSGMELGLPWHLLLAFCFLLEFSKILVIGLPCTYTGTTKIGAALLSHTSRSAPSYAAPE